MFSADQLRTAEQLLADMRSRGLRLATAESCTGGLIAGLLTEIAGSSDVLERGLVTYSNEAKRQLLSVPAATIERYGAVSEATARAMAAGALAGAPVDIAVAVTGVAGPGGGSAEKPVGLVHLAVAGKGLPTRHRECRFGDIGRSAIRLATVMTALELIREAMGNIQAPPG